MLSEGGAAAVSLGLRLAMLVEGPNGFAVEKLSTHVFLFGSIDVLSSVHVYKYIYICVCVRERG